MASFSASDAALTGFRIVRERPKAVAVWAAVQFVIALASSLIMVSLAGPFLDSLKAGGGATRDPAAAMAMFRQVGPLYLFFVLFALIFYPILYAAMNRAVLRPNDEGFGYFRLGADELRQLGLTLMMVGLVLVAYIALIIVVAAMAATFSTAFGARTGAAAGAAAPLILLAVLLGFAVICLWIYFWVRLSLASALTFATRRVNLFGSWTLTRGLFWPMFGAYLVAAILVVVVLMLTGVITLAITAAFGGGLAGIAQATPSTVASVLTPARLAGLVISSAANALVWPVMLTPPAAIYQSLPGSVSAIDAAAAFD